MTLQDNYMAITCEFTGKVLQKYPEKVDVIILFGSTARGEAREESDIDIRVVGGCYSGGIGRHFFFPCSVIPEIHIS